MDPDRFAKYAERALSPEAAIMKTDQEDGDGVESSFSIELTDPMGVSEVRSRLLNVLAETSGLLAESLSNVEPVDVDERFDGEVDVDFVVDFAFDQTVDNTEHALAAIDFAEWLEDSQNWIREVYPDIVWFGPPATTELGLAKSSGGFCSVGDIPFNSSGWDRDWALKSVRVAQAHAYSKAQNRRWGGEGIKVGHIDTGYKAHREMDGACLPQEGWDFFKKQPGGFDPGVGKSWGHGDTTGSVMVSRHDSFLVKGVAPNAHTVPYRAVKWVVVTSGKNLVRAIKLATLEERPVLSMSLGTLACYSALRKAVRKALMADVISVAAAGNCVGFLVAPAKCDGAVAVSGIGHDDTPWPHASRDGKGRIDIAAPAEWVTAAGHQNANSDLLSRRGEGTSYATAMTAGAAAVWLAHHGRDACIHAAHSSGLWLNQYFQRLLRDTARVPTGWNQKYGAGILDIESLLRAGLPVYATGKALTAPPLDALASTEEGELSVRELFENALAAADGVYADD